MSRRFFSEQPVRGEQVILHGAEAHHLAHVMRNGPGDLVVVFDDSGWEFPSEVQKITRHQVQLAVQARHRIDRELPWTLTLAVALPRGDRQEWLTEKLVELGVTRLVPLQTERSVAIPGRQTPARLQRAVIEASKQCGRNRLMEIHRPVAFADFVVEATDAGRLLAQPGATSRPIGELLATTSLPPASEWRAIVGPEGGLSEAEARLARDVGWLPVDLGARTLRTETAAIALAAHLVLGTLGGPRISGGPHM